MNTVTNLFVSLYLYIMTLTIEESKSGNTYYNAQLKSTADADKQKIRVRDEDFFAVSIQGLLNDKIHIYLTAHPNPGEDPTLDSYALYKDNSGNEPLDATNLTSGAGAFSDKLEGFTTLLLVREGVVDGDVELSIGTSRQK